MKLRVYLDTSVFSAYYDNQVSDRRVATAEFWTRLEEFDAATSAVAREELARVADEERRAKLLGLLDRVQVHALTEEMTELARRYIDGGCFTPGMFFDALHVAAAVLTGQDVLVSWNFRHLVNRRRRAQVNQVNISLALPTIEIVAPPEI